jgi:hypothetical protein
LTFQGNLLSSCHPNFFEPETAMLSFISPLRGVGGNGAKTYQCAARLFMEKPPRSTPGFRATAGEWPSVITAANI